MPLVSNQQNRNISYPYRMDGVQFIENTITFPTSPATATIYLSRDIYSSGTYALFDYSRSSAATPVLGDINQVTVDVSDLLLADSATLSNDTTNKVIKVIITAKTDNGKQFVDGTLTINDPMTIYLSEDLFGTAGTYTLFSYGTFVGNISNITIEPPNGLSVDTGVSPNGCADTGSTITVKLL